MTRIRALVLILIGVAVGSLIRSVHAQTDVVLFQVGQRLTLSYIDERSIDCIRSIWTPRKTRLAAKMSNVILSASYGQCQTDPTVQW